MDHLSTLHGEDQDSVVQQQTVEKFKFFSMAYTMKSERILTKEIQEGREPGSREKASHSAPTQEAAVTLF